MTFPEAPHERDGQGESDGTKRYVYIARPKAVFDFGVTTLGLDIDPAKERPYLWKIQDICLERFAKYGGKCISTISSTFDGSPTLEYWVALSDGTTVRIRSYIRGQCYYVLSVSGVSEAVVANADAERFLASFQYER